MKKVFSILLLIALLAEGMTSCGQDTPTETETESADTAPLETDETAVTPDVPEQDFGGYAFRIISTKDSTTLPNEIDCDEQSGNALSDAVYERNLLTEEKYNIVISQVPTNNDYISKFVENACIANDDAYDAAVEIIAGFKNCIMSGYLYDVSDLPYIDAEKPWWTGSMINSSEIAGKRFLTFGDFLWTDKARIWTVMFNKNMAKEAALGDVYALVREGKWTLDTLEEHCQNVTRDLNGDGAITHEDVWGFLGSYNTGTGLLSGCGIMATESTGDGLHFLLDSAQNMDALDKVYAFIASDEKMLRAESITGVPDIWVARTNIFREGRALYQIDVMEKAVALRDMEDDFGIIPMPKLDETQAEYTTTYQGWSARALAVPTTVSDPERNSMILEYMAYVSRDTMRPAFYDVTLQGKSVRDKESAEMLDMIIDNVTADIGLALEIGTIRTSITDMINAESNTIASSIASVSDAIQAKLDEFYEKVSAID